MKYMLDTNIIIYLIYRSPINVYEKLCLHEIDDVCISSITYAELNYEIEKSNQKYKSRIALMSLMSTIRIVDFDAKAAEQYGIIRSNLEKTGNVIGNMDMLIAAHALSLDLTVVTNNTREFARVNNLKVENWTI